MKAHRKKLNETKSEQTDETTSLPSSSQNILATSYSQIRSVADFQVGIDKLIYSSSEFKPKPLIPDSTTTSLPNTPEFNEDEANELKDLVTPLASPIDKKISPSRKGKRKRSNNVSEDGDKIKKKKISIKKVE